LEEIKPGPVSSKSDLLGMSIVWVGSVAGFLFLWHFGHPTLHTILLNPESWRPTEAVVLENGTRSCSRSARGSAGYRRVTKDYVKYEYTVDKVTHTSHKVRPGDSNDPCRGIDSDDFAWLSSFPAGSKITAYVDPDSVEEVALRPANKPMGFLGWMVLLVWLAVTAIFVFYMLAPILIMLFSLFEPGSASKDETLPK
jgi:hypothetical protein